MIKQKKRANFSTLFLQRQNEQNSTNIGIILIYQTILYIFQSSLLIRMFQILLVAVP